MLDGCYELRTLRGGYPDLGQVVSANAPVTAAGAAGKRRELKKEATMQRSDVVVMVAGTTIGVGGGALGSFLACTAGRVLARRFLDQNRYIDLGPAGSRAVRTCSAPATQRSAPVAPPACNQDRDQELPRARTAVRGAYA